MVAAGPDPVPIGGDGLATWLETIADETAEASETGQTVVLRVRVTTSVNTSVAKSGRAGQSVIVTAQLVIVWTSVATTVKVVCGAAETVVFRARRMWK